MNGFISVFSQFLTCSFVKLLLFKSYGMYYCSNPSLVFSMTRASEVATWNISQCKGASYLSLSVTQYPSLSLSYFPYTSPLYVCQLGPDIYGCVEYDVKLHMCTCTVSACLYLNHFVRYNLVCYIKITGYCICQCFYPIHTNELLCDTLYRVFWNPCNTTLKRVK